MSHIAEIYIRLVDRFPDAVRERTHNTYVISPPAQVRVAGKFLIILHRWPLHAYLATLCITFP